MNDYEGALAQFLVSEKDTRPFNDTIRRTMLTPFAQSGYNNAPTYAAPSVLMDIYNAATLPKRVYDGKTAPNDIGENLNFTMNMMGGGTAFGRPANSLGSGGVRAYHGSPHDFDKFDMSRIGTGEGAQAYGHGLYFAENEGVAKSYRDTLSKGMVTTLDNQFDPKNMARVRMSASGWDAPRAQQNIQLEINDIMSSPAYRNPATPEIAEYVKNEVNGLRDALELVKSGEPLDKGLPGRLYEVNIKADPNDFLDWDKPLSQQSEKIRDTLVQLGMSPNATGEGVMAALERRAIASGGREASGTVKEAASPLRQAGIPGIKYLDQGSRGAGEGSRNYVVFDDSLVEILRKYGLIGGAVGLGAASQQGDY